MWDKLRKLALERECRRSCGIDGRNLVEQIGEPHKLGIIVHVHTPDGVVDQLFTDGHLLGDILLTIVHDGTTDVEVLVELIVQV